MYCLNVFVLNGMSPCTKLYFDTAFEAKLYKDQLEALLDQNGIGYVISSGQKLSPVVSVDKEK